MRMLILILILLISVRSSGQNKSIFPALSFTEVIQGSKADIGNWGDGKVYVIELWGTWCVPCIRNIPKLTQLQQKYTAKGLVVIGYSWEDPGLVKKMVEKMGDKMKYTLVNDRDEKFLKIVADEKNMVESFPFTFVIDRKGNLVWSGNPEDGLEQFISNFFK